jgi:uncharacterized membrane protein YeaQ/YmgE (transglycosylase-associated protein family)
VVFLIFSIVVGGLIIGALGRLAVPGPNPMGILATILVGVGGSIIGGIVSRLIWADPQNHVLLVITLEVLGAAGIVWLMSGRRRRVP